MIKRIISVKATIVLLFLIAYFLHDWYLTAHNISVRFSVLSVYLFQAIASFVVYFQTELFFKFSPSQAGLLYLFLGFVKNGVFFFAFKDGVFTEPFLIHDEKVLLIIPLFLFMIIEKIAVVKLLSSNEL